MESANDPTVCFYKDRCHILDDTVVVDLEFDRFVRGEHSYGDIWKWII